MRAWNDYVWRDAWHHSVSDREYEAEVFGFSFPELIDPRSPYALCGVSLVVDLAVTPNAVVDGDEVMPPCPECDAARASAEAEAGVSVPLLGRGMAVSMAGGAERPEDKAVDRG